MAALHKLSITWARTFDVRDRDAWREANRDRSVPRTESRMPRQHEEDHGGRRDPRVARAWRSHERCSGRVAGDERPIVAVYELALWFERKGLTNVQGMGIGGTVNVAGLQVSMVPAVSSSVVENETNVYLGQPAGFVVRMEDERSFYFAGDTALFGDMRLIAEIRTEIAFLPIGDHFTMIPRQPLLQPACLVSVRSSRCTTGPSPC
jgi:hypothetical protein